ncbi:type 4a pilus biogenesis protein PilO [Candidatus Poribacteria bacterium]
MNWRRLALLLILLLIFTIVWGGMELKGSYEELSSVRAGDTSSTTTQLLSLQKRIDTHRTNLSDLERLTLWKSDSDFMSWVTQQADGTGVRVIGVEHQPVEQESDYHGIPVTITIRGDYNPLGRFINQLERSPSAIRINSMRIRRKEHPPQYMVMDLSMSYFQRAVESL